MIKEQFNSGWIRAYDSAETKILWKSKQIKFLAKYQKEFKRSGVRSILDIGCGDGRNAFYLLKKKFFVIGLDISKTAVDRATKAAIERKLTNGIFLCSDVNSLPSPFLSDTFDAIVCLDSFGQFSQPKYLIDSIYRLLHKGGMLLLNLYTINDDTYGQGKKLSKNKFLYKETLFRYYDELEARRLFAKFKILNLEVMKWRDPPHPGFRDYPHTHESIVLLLQK